MSVNLVIKRLGTGTAAQAEVPVDVPTTSTVEELKEQVAVLVDLPKENIRLVCAGRVWDNARTVGSYEVQDGMVVHCLNNPPRATPAAAEQTLTQANPMRSMLGALPASNAGASGDPMQNMMAQAQQRMMQNPEMLQQMMNSPMVQQMMSNPEIMRAMIRMNPQLNQLMEQRPEIARILDDPETLQQSMRMMSNPALMREMIRNQDRALGQLDVMPGGHAALANAHADLVDPLFAAMSGGEGAVAPTTNTYDQATEGAPNTDALPNPWGAPAQPSATPPAAIPAAATPAPTSAPAMATTPQLAAGLGGAAPPMNPFAMMMPQAGTWPQNQQPQGQNAGVNPMGNMMQQMMANPAVMQRMMQVMNNPAAMQQVQQMQQSMFSGGTGGMGMGSPTMGAPIANLGTPTAPTPATGQTPAANSPSMMAVQRVRFASQLAQLSAMGFTDEALCLQVLQQHNGRVDAAIDTLLSS